MQKSDEPTLITAQPVHGSHARRSRPVFSYDDFKVLATDAVARFGDSSPRDFEEAAYREEYDILARWFADHMAGRTWTAEAVRLGALAIYGWMPTILRVHGRGEVSTDSAQVDFTKIANALNEGDDTKIEKNFLNRSYVGTSKFLHFCWPERFAIWDSNIKKALGWKGAEEGNCIRYQSFMTCFCAENKAHTLREVEFALFRMGKEKSATDEQ